MTLIDHLPAGGPEYRAQDAEGTLVYESGRSRVLRVRAGEQADPVTAGAGGYIWKGPLGPGADVRMRRELRILARLADVPGVAHLVETQGRGNGFAVEDVGDVSLAALLSRPDGHGGGVRAGSGVVDMVTFALALTQVITRVHQAGVVHKDINPANILIREPAGQPVLIDLDLA